jgi:non-homologous end joining protein Ku
VTQEFAAHAIRDHYEQHVSEHVQAKAKPQDRCDLREPIAPKLRDDVGKNPVNA